MSRMTNDEYKNNGGTKCPFCQSENIEGGQFTVDAGIATQPMGCTDCESEWDDQYSLVGYTA